MASFMKSKITGLFRSLVRSGDRPPRPASVASAQPSFVPPAPVPAMTAPMPNRASAAPVPSAPPIPETAPAGTIEVPLAPVIATLPMDLRARLSSAPAGKMIYVPADLVLSQLAFGVVKITFGELCRLAPEAFASISSEHDQRPVNLPLSEILSRINPALLARRPAQQVEVDDAISGPFGGHGQGVSFSSQPLKPSAPTTPPAAAPRFVTPAASPATTLLSRQTTPAIPFTPLKAPPAENGDPAETVHGGNQELPPFRFTLTPAAPAAAPAAVNPTPQAPTMSWPPAEAQPAISVLLGDLAESWPEEIKKEIALCNLAAQPVMLAASVVEPGLKRGRVMLVWKDLRILAKPNSPTSPNDGLELDLPLKVLAPAFLAAQKKGTRPQSKVTVSAEIPNLFFGFPQAAAEPSAPAVPPPSSAAVMPLPGFSSRNGEAARPVVVTSPAFNPPPARTADTNLFVKNAAPAAAPAAEEVNVFQRQPAPGTDFLSRQLHPKEVVAGAMKLPGVAGAVVAIVDGLRVAGEVPAGLNADTVAAFLPQIYDRVNQSTRELRMGALNNLSFTVGNVPWKIFRINSVYFAAFGRAGEPLPTSQLAALAAGLERKGQ